MKQLEFVELTHANLGYKLFLVPSKAFYVYYSDTHKSTCVASGEGAVVPVKEGVLAVKEKVQIALGGNYGEE